MGGWPFWLLVAAWCFANVSQQASADFMVWVGNGRHFSHQERLRADVSELLSGKKAATVAAAPRADRARLPAMPAANTEGVRKIDLYAPVTAECASPPAQALTHATAPVHVPESLKPEPLLAPPRASSLA